MIRANPRPTSSSSVPRPRPVSPGRFVLTLVGVWVGGVGAGGADSGPKAPPGWGCGGAVTAGADGAAVVAVAALLLLLLPAACAAGAATATTVRARTRATWIRRTQNSLPHHCDT